MKNKLYKDYYIYADFYDIFSKYRNYNIEGKYLLDMIKNRKRILDVGCGTGTHLEILENLGYIVEGIDISNKMLMVCKTKTRSKVHEMNVLDFALDEKYDAIICMRSVLNHLNNYNEFKQAVINMLNHTKKNGMIIIDLDNKRINGIFEEKIDGNKRIIEAKYDKEKELQFRKITYFIGTKKFEMEHIYLIYDYRKLEKLLDELNIKYALLTNYSKQRFNNKNRRLQIIIKKL